jgi:serine phosphatase RsbU (regulator of sigma subunit)
VEWLPATATVIGVFEDWTCETGTARGVPGDVLAVYSDGLTEAMRGIEQFGDARLAALLRELATSPADCLVSGLLRRVQDFCDAGSSDDLTLLVAKVR